jgi:hypothetical protein
MVAWTRAHALAARRRGRRRQRFGVRRAVLLGAFLADVVYSRPVRVSGSMASQWRLRLGLEGRYEGLTGSSAASDRLGRDGQVVSRGGPAALHRASPNHEAPWPGAEGRDVPGDAQDEQPLRAAAAEFEQRNSAQVASEPALSEYVRALKKREFAQ